MGFVCVCHSANAQTDILCVEAPNTDASEGTYSEYAAFPLRVLRTFSPRN